MKPRLTTRSSYHCSAVTVPLGAAGASKGPRLQHGQAEAREPGTVPEMPESRAAGTRYFSGLVSSQEQAAFQTEFDLDHE